MPENDDINDIGKVYGNWMIIINIFHLLFDYNYIK